MQNSVMLRSGFILLGVLLLLLVALVCAPTSRQIELAILSALNQKSLNSFQPAGSIVASDTIPVPWPPPTKKSFYVIKNSDFNIVDDDSSMGQPISVADFNLTKTMGMVSPENKLGGLLILKLEPGEKVFVVKATPAAK